MYPKIVKPADVVDEFYAPNIFRIKNGSAFYDQVHNPPNTTSVYLVRLESDLGFVKRWISWDEEIEQMFEYEDINR